MNRVQWQVLLPSNTVHSAFKLRTWSLGGLDRWAQEANPIVQLTSISYPTLLAGPQHGGLMAKSLVSQASHVAQTLPAGVGVS